MTSEMSPVETPGDPQPADPRPPETTSAEETAPADARPVDLPPTQADLVPPQAVSAEVPPAEAPLAAEAAAVAVAVPEAAPVSGTPARVPGTVRKKRDRVLGTIGQVVGIVGIVVCLLLAVGDVVGREWAVRTVDDVAASVDTQIAKADPLLAQASSVVGEISGRVSTVGDIAAGIAADPGPGGAVADTLRAALATVSDRYQTLRANYVDVRGSVQSMVDRLQTLDRVVPGFSIPQGPVDALAALDARLQAFDAKVSGLITIDPGQGPVNKAAAAIAQTAGDANAKLTDLQGGIGDVQQRVSALRTKLFDTAGTIKLGITLGAIGAILVLLYFALLHWVLFRHSGEIRRKTSAG